MNKVYLLEYDATEFFVFEWKEDAEQYAEYLNSKTNEYKSYSIVEKEVKTTHNTPEIGPKDKTERIKLLIKRMRLEHQEALKANEEHDKAHPPVYDEAYYEGLKWLDENG